MFLTPTMYNAYKRADNNTTKTPNRFNDSVFPLYKRVMPIEVSIIETIVVFVIFQKQFIEGVAQSGIKG